jgi:hypothetical protein
VKLAFRSRSELHVRLAFYHAARRRLARLERITVHVMIAADPQEQDHEEN